MPKLKADPASLPKWARDRITQQDERIAQLEVEQTKLPDYSAGALIMDIEHEGVAYKLRFTQSGLVVSLLTAVGVLAEGKQTVRIISVEG